MLKIEIQNKSKKQHETFSRLFRIAILRHEGFPGVSRHLELQRDSLKHFLGDPDGGVHGNTGHFPVGETNGDCLVFWP